MSALITLSSVLHGTAQSLSGLIRIIMEIAHSFSSIHQISCQFIDFLCKDRRPAYLLMRQGTASCALQFIIKEQCPASFLSHSHYQGVMSCSISNTNSSRQLPGFAIRDISMSDPATELIPSPSDSKLLFAIVPIIPLGLTIMPLIWLHFIKCRYPGVGSHQFSILNYCSTDSKSKRVSILIHLTHSTGCQLASHFIHFLIQSSCHWLLSQEQCLPYLAYSLYAAYPACSLWLFLPIHCMRLILPAHYGYSMPIHCMWLILPAYGYSMPMASPEGAMPPSSMTPAHYIMASSNAAHY
jgi:hypothetical protein